MFANRLKELRAEKGMTQVQLAETLCVSKGTVAMWETSKREPNYETLNKLSKTFDKRIDYILGYSNDPSSPRQVEESYQEIVTAHRMLKDAFESLSQYLVKLNRQ